MARIKFGTDGVRGVANRALLPEDAFAIGLAAGRLIRELGLAPRVLLGRDTRQSGTMLGAALAAGFCSSGVEVTALGWAPTGAISYLTRTGDYALGAVISASHNPAEDNGIKLIAHDGRKISDEHEKRVVALLDEPFLDRPEGGDVGAIVSSREELARYEQFLLSLVPEGLDGLKVVVDMAHGAGVGVGADVFEKLGATVIRTGEHPDGANINAEGGATKPERIQELAKLHQADLGVAYDGDADRAVFADADGNLVNGDRMMGIWAAHWRRHGQFEPAVIVGTVMSNGGFEAYVRSEGIHLERTDVGDKYVSRRMAELGAKIGGEQSGHIIIAERGPTGDGLVTALELARVLKREGKPLAEFTAAFENWPQLLVNVKVDRKEGWTENPVVRGAISQAEAALDGAGRLNVRASGTQPMLRVMVEASDAGIRDEQAEAVVGALLGELGGEIYSRVDLTHALGD